MHDEGRDYRGLDVSADEQTVRLRAGLTGEFAGSLVKVDDTFTLANDQIASHDFQ